MYGFPKEPGLRKKWADQVKRTRSKWEPTDHSKLCSKHFEKHCIENYGRLSESLGIVNVRALLKPGAIPTIFEKPLPAKRKACSSPSGTPIRKRRKAYEKRERARVSILVDKVRHKCILQTSILGNFSIIV